MKPNPSDYWLHDDREQPGVLLVDDNMVVVKLVIQTLAPYNLRCHWARSTAEARQILQVFPIDLVIADIRLPFMNGIELARWIREQPGISEIPVLFFTSAADRQTIQTAAAVRDVDYVLKPLRPRVFCERVLRLISDRQTQ